MMTSEASTLLGKKGEPRDDSVGLGSSPYGSIAVSSYSHSNPLQNDGGANLTSVVASSSGPGSRKRLLGWKTILFGWSAYFALCAAVVKWRHQLEKPGNYVIERLQQLTEEPVTWVDSVGIDPTYLLILPAPLIYFPFVSGRALAERLMLLNGATRYLKWFFDILMRQGRPFWVSSSVRMLHCPELYGSPSGHAALWYVFLVPLFRSCFRNCNPRERSRVFLFALVFTVFYFCVLFSRLYVGTHYPHSLIMGVLLGGLVDTSIHERVSFRLRSFTRSWLKTIFRSFFCLSISLAALVLFAVATVDLVDRFAPDDPTAWTLRVQNSTQCSALPNTRSLTPAYEAAGGIIGILFAVACSTFAFHSVSSPLNTEPFPLRLGFGLTQMIAAWALTMRIPQSISPRNEASCISAALILRMLCQFAGGVFTFYISERIFRMA